MRKWNIVAILVVLGLLGGGFGCAAPAPAPTPTPTAKPAPAPAPAPTTTAPAPAPAPTAKPATTTAPAPTAKPAPKPTEMKITCGSTGSSTHINIVIMSEMINKHSDWLRATPISTPGYIDSLKMLQQSRTDIAASGAIEAKNMIAGTEYFKDAKYTGLRWLWPFLYSPVNIVSKKGSKFKTLQDLKDATVGYPPIGSAGNIGAESLHKALGFQPKKILNYSYSELPSALKDGTVDVIYMAVALKSAQMVEASMINDLQWIPLDDESWKKLDELNLGYQRLPTPAGTYHLQDKEVLCQAWSSYMYTREDVSADLVYEVTRTFWDNFDEARKLNVAVITQTKECIDSMLSLPGPCPIHPSAAKYFKEKGILK